MREILFRGKRIDNGKWVYGSYIKANHHWHERGIHDDWIATDIVQNGGYCNVRGRYAVIPSTVGQYIGLTDKNGKRIFEGDILRYWSERKEEYVEYCVVEYGMFNCSCCSGVYGWYLRDGDIRYCDTEYTTGMYEVCGNIHDNPELLEVSNNE